MRTRLKITDLCVDILDRDSVACSVQARGKTLVLPQRHAPLLQLGKPCCNARLHNVWLSLLGVPIG